MRSTGSVAICNNRVVEGVSPKPPDGDYPPLSETVRSTGKRSDMSPPANREILLWILSYKKADFLFINFQTSKIDHYQRFIEVLPTILTIKPCSMMNI